MSEKEPFMKKFDFYEFAAILVPGAVMTYGLSRIYPEIGLISRDKEVTFGELGLLLILSYAGGHLVQSLGNFIEWIWWKCFSGWPSDWVKNNQQSILASAQAELLPVRIRELLHIKCPDDLSAMTPKDWKPITRQLYAATRKMGRTDRVDIFNGYYGMFRGLTAAILVILIAALTDLQERNWRLLGALTVMAGLALLRMHRFGVHYARELFVQFIEIEAGEPISNKPKEENE